jgi:hypothetical protein
MDNMPKCEKCGNQASHVVVVDGKRASKTMTESEAAKAAAAINAGITESSGTPKATVKQNLMG